MSGEVPQPGPVELDTGPDADGIPVSDGQRKASLMQRTDTILERIDVTGGEEDDETEEEAVPFVDVNDPPPNNQHSIDGELGYTTLASLNAGSLRRHNVLVDDDEISDVMTSSLVCTDGSDVEVLSDRDMSDVAENGTETGLESGVQQNITPCDSDSDAPKSGSEGGTPNRTPCSATNRAETEAQTTSQSEALDNLNKKTQDVHINTDSATQSGAQQVQSTDVVVQMKNEPKVDATQARLLLEKAESMRSSDSDSEAEGAQGDAGQDLEDEELMSVSMTGRFDSLTGHVTDRHADSPPTTDLDQLANGSVNRPDSLSLPRPLQSFERQHKKQLVRSESKSSSCSNYSQSSTEALIEAATVTPLHVQGKLTRQGDSIEFVAEDLDEKIRMSSPLNKRDAWMVSRTSSNRSISSVSSSASGLSMSSASGWSAVSNTSGGMSRSPSVVTQSPEDIPPIDPRAVLDLELYARRVAHNLDAMMGNLNSNLHKMSRITVGCVDSYKDGIDRTCDSVDASIKSMYALMAKCEELSRNIKPVYRLADQIKEIKRLLDLFEAQLAKDEKPPL